MNENIISNSKNFSTSDLLKDSTQTFGVYFNGNITLKNANYLINGINNLISIAKKDNLSHLFIGINSFGGLIEAASLIKDFLDSTKEHFKIITHNAGIVASSANIIYMAGDYKISLPRGYFYFHEVFIFGDNQNYKLSETLSRSFMLRKHTSLFKGMLNLSLSVDYHTYINQLLYSDSLLLAEQTLPLEENLKHSENINSDDRIHTLLPFSAVECGYTDEIVDTIRWNPNICCLQLPD